MGKGRVFTVLSQADLDRLAEQVGGHDEALEHLREAVRRIDEMLEQMQAVLECLPAPAPVFLRWAFDTVDGCERAKVRFGKWTAEVVNGSSAVSWTVADSRGYIVEAGGGYTEMSSGLDEAEEALRRVVQTGIKASTGRKPVTHHELKVDEHGFIDLNKPGE